MPVTGYDIDAIRPIAPSESKRNWAGLARRVVGGGTLGGAAGAALGKYTGMGTGLGAATGAALGLTHGALKAQEHQLSDQTTQERMEMRRALSDYKKQQARQAKEKKAMEINGAMLRAMNQELTAIQKEAELNKEAFPVAAIGKALGSVGTKVLGGTSKGLKALAGRGGTVGQLAGSARKTMASGVGKGVKRFGAERFRQGVGAATLGAGALGASALASRGRRD